MNGTIMIHAVTALRALLAGRIGWRLDPGAAHFQPEAVCFLSTDRTAALVKDQTLIDEKKARRLDEKMTAPHLALPRPQAKEGHNRSAPLRENHSFPPSDGRLRDLNQHRRELLRH